MTSIYDVGPGDYVKDLQGQIKKIKRIDPVVDQTEPWVHYRSWTVHTEDGEALTMYDVRLYYRASEIEEKYPSLKLGQQP